MFDSLDRLPLREKDLDRIAEQYIVESINELPSRTECELEIYLDQPRTAPDEENVVGEAVHFISRAERKFCDAHDRFTPSILSGAAVLRGAP